MEAYRNKLSDIIKRVLLKSYSFNQKNNFFDEFESVLIDNNITEKKYFLILNLIDYYEDAINHNFKEIDTNYSLNQAQQDLLFLSDLLKNNFNIEIPADLYKRLYALYQ